MKSDFFYQAECQKKPDIRELALSNGLSYPSDEELVMLILGSGTKNNPIEKVSRKVTEAILSSNENDVLERLQKISGIGQAKAISLAAALELGKRLNRNPQAKITSPCDIIPYVQMYAVQPVEHFLCITMNGSQEILAIRVISVGGGNKAVIRPREVFCEAVKERAAAVIICHNHPGGDPTPSSCDIKSTENLHKSADILGIALLDHIIIAKNGYFSFLESGML